MVHDDSVLVRVRDSGAGFDRVGFTEKTNVPTVAAYSETENAAMDAKKLTPTILATAEVKGGELNTSGNSGFILRFINGVIPASERGSFVDSKGEVSQRGLLRIRNALFQRAYGNQRMTDQLAEVADPDAKNVIKAMTNVAPMIALMAEDIKKGRMHDVLPVKEIVKAYEVYKNLKANDIKVVNWLGQQEFIDRHIPTDYLLVELFEKNKGSAAALTNAFESILSAVQRHGNPNQTMFPGLETAKPNAEAIIREGIAAFESEREAASRRFSNRDEFGIDELSKESKNNIKMRGDVVVSSIEALNHHIKQAMLPANNKLHTNLYIGAIDTDTRNALEQATNTKLFTKPREYAFSVSYDDIRHIDKHFKKASEKANAIMRMYGMLKNFDSASAFRTPLNELRIKLEKSFPDANYLSISVIGNQRRAVDLVTIYITELNIEKDGQSGLPDASNGPGNPQQGSSASDTSIPPTSTDSQDIRYSTRDSEGRELTQEQQEFFKDSKVRDEDGKLLVVYHGTDANFNVFDRTKSRANMDIQGNFFSPWEDDAAGYGMNVRKFYLNIKNPATESIGYKALRKFQGQNYAGVKARDYLIQLGYDGVNNGGEEYIAFSPEQIKSVDNLNPTTNPDIRYSSRLSPAEKRKLDADYMAAVKAGDMETAQRMVNDYAAARGYDADNDFRMTHEAPTNDGFNKPIYDMTAIYPSDFYEKGVEYYGSYTERGLDYEALSKLRKVRGKPDARLWIYRAVPADVKGDHFRNGDWVTITRGYAQMHGRDNIEGAYRVIEKATLAGAVATNSDSLSSGIELDATASTLQPYLPVYIWTRTE